MLRESIRSIFNAAGPAVLPVVHVRDHRQTGKNVAIAVAEEAQGVFLINHDFGVDRFLPIIRRIRARFSDIWMGLNFLAVTGKDAFSVLADMEKQGCKIDGYWADDARIDESRSADDQPEAAEILEVKRQCGWNGVYFGGTAFKKQRLVDADDYEKSASVASRWMDVVTTSGAATGEAAGTDKINLFRAGVGDGALALASGVTPENAADYRDSVDAILVATGISAPGDFYHIDRKRLKKLLENVNR